MAGKRRVQENIPLPSLNLELEIAVRALSEHTNKVPTTEEEFALDIGLARTAVDIAMERHAGIVEIFYTPMGSAMMLEGKDLTGVKTVIGTGGVFAYGREPWKILEAARFRPENPLSLRPKAPAFFVDGAYVMYAVGLLSMSAPDKALRVMKKYLKPL